MKTQSQIPIATLILIAANVFAAFAIVLSPDIVFQFGFDPTHPSVYHALTSLFLHENLFHLLGNLVFLAAVGASVEMIAGSMRFSIVYFVSGIVGVVAHWLFAPRVGEIHPVIGASGCIAGCAAYYCSRYLQLKVPLAPKIGTSVAVVTFIWLILQVVGIFVQIGDPASTISYWAHIGGFVAGFVLSFAFRAPDIGTRKLGHSVLAKMNIRGPAATIVAAERHLEKHPDDIIVLKELVTALEKTGDQDKEAEALFRLMEQLPEIEQLEPLIRLAEIKHLELLPSLRRMMFADRFGEEHPHVARMLLLSILDSPPETQYRAEALLALINLEMNYDKKYAYNLLEDLEKTYPMHPVVDLARAKGWLK